MVWEADYWSDSCFVTLTYDDDHLPLDGSLDKREFQLFMKRLRKSIEGKCVYFACGEYGERYGRPHFHAVIFGIGTTSSQDISDSWGKGQVQVSVFKVSRARYCAGYLLKEVDSRVDLNCKVPPFCLMSKRLGKRFAEANAYRILDGQTLTINGSPVALPRYFRKLLDVNISSNDSMIKYRVESRNIHLLRISGWKGKRSVVELEDSFQAVREQVNLNQTSWESVKEGRLNGL